jgi:hypothetical protein
MQFADNTASALGAFTPNFGHMPLALFSTILGWTVLIWRFREIQDRRFKDEITPHIIKSVPSL